MKLVEEQVDGETYALSPLGLHIVRAPDVCGGRPTFKYTRIEVAGALGRLAAGESVDSIVSGYNGRVSREAVLEAIDIAARNLVETLPDIAAR